MENSAKVDKANLLQYIAPMDLKAFGLIPEIVGRLPILTYLKPLDKKALRDILTEPKNSIIRQYVHLFKLDGVELVFTDDALDFIVDKAEEYKLGARGLRSIVENILRDALFEIPSSRRREFHLTEEYARTHIDENLSLQ